MFEFKEGETGLHKIENPGQVIFIGLVFVIILVGISLAIGFSVSKL